MVDVTAGLYNINSNSYQWGNVREVTDGATSFLTSNIIFNSTINFDKYYPCFRIRYRTDPDELAYGSVGSYLDTCRIVLSSCRFWLDLNATGDSREYDLTNSAVPFNALSNIKYHFNTIDEDGSVNYNVNEYTSESLTFSNYNFTRGNPDIENSYYGFTFDGSSSKQYTTENIRGGSIDYIEYIVIYDFNSINFGKAYTSTPDIPNSSDYVRVLFGLNTSGGSPVNVNVLLSQDGQYNNDNQFISNSINNVTTQVSQIKTQLTQSTNTISTKIDTMSQDIQTGLSNVVESAQQNTQNIINTVTQKVDEVKTGITEVKDSILDLPNKISEMLIGLVVPDEQTMIEQRDNWDSLLAERFGAVYESVEVMDSIAAAFQSSTETSTITLPAVTVGLAGTDFTFGGYDVEVVPEGFDALVTALKLIIDIVVTLAFINAMKLRYEQLVSR